MASIIELIKNIRNARLGKDVRESIASAIEQTYEDASEQGNANMEVVQARGTFDTLNQRLNNSDSVKANMWDIENKAYDKVIMIGDSYGVGNTKGGFVTGWCDRLKVLMNIPNNNYFKFVEGGAGFNRKGQNQHTFLELLQANIDNISDKNKVKKVIVCGGYNDNSFTSPEITINVGEFISYCKNQFPNATIYVGMVGNSKANNTNGAALRNSISNGVLRGYQNCVTFGAVYLNGIENIMHDYINFMSDDYIHPTETGYKYLSSYLFNAIKTGYADYQSEVYNATLNFTDMTEDSTFNIKSKLSNNVVTLFSPASNIKFNTPKNIGNSIVLGDIDIHFFRPTTRLVSIPVKYYMRTNSDTYYGGIGNLILNTNGTLTFMPGILLNDGTPYFNVQNVTSINFEAFNYTTSTSNG